MKKLSQFLTESVQFIRQMLTSSVLFNDSLFAQVLRRRLYRTECFIDTQVIIKNPKNFKSGADSALYHGSYILNSDGIFEMGNTSHLGAYCYVNVCHGRVFIGDDVAIGPGTKIIAYSNHFKQGEKVTSVRLTEDIVIKNNVFIGANCTLLPGTVIEDNVIVGAGSVVKGVLEPDSIYVGSPCRKVRSGWYSGEIPESEQ